MNDGTQSPGNPGYPEEDARLLALLVKATKDAFPAFSQVCWRCEDPDCWGCCE